MRGAHTQILHSKKYNNNEDIIVYGGTGIRAIAAEVAATAT